MLVEIETQRRPEACLMSRLSTRLASLEKRHKPRQEMRGAIEVHCVGGWQKVEGGQQCNEHERCVYRSTPVSGAIRRVIMFDWVEGIENPFNE